MKQEDKNSTFSVGKRIRIIRKRKGMSQEDLAEKMFTSKQMISAYETDKIDIKVSVLKEFGKALEISPTVLLDEDFDKSTQQVVLETLEHANIINLYSTLPVPFKELAYEQLKALSLCWMDLKFKCKEKSSQEKK